MNNIIKTTTIALNLIEPNKGQIEGVPANPRILDADDYERLVKSIQTNPEMLNLRELIVYPHEGKYVVIGGNMRWHVLKMLEYTEAPCKIIPEKTTAKQLREITIKDNHNEGEWIDDMLREDWKDDPIDDWGVYLNELNEDIQDDDEKVNTNTLSLKFAPDQFRFLKQKLNDIDKDNAKAIIYLLHEYGN